MTSIPTFLREVRGELSKVSWPSRQQLLLYTAVVIGLCFVLALYLGGIDALAAYLVAHFIVK